MTDYTFNYSLYKKRINKKNNLVFVFIVLFIILILSMFIFIKPNKKNYEFYFVEIANFQTYSKALNLSNELKNQSATGYIYFDGNYHVLVNFYSNKKDAEKVCDNLKSLYVNADVYTIKISENLKLSTLTKKKRTNVENLINNCYKSIKGLSYASILLDKKEISIIEFNIKVSNLVKAFTEEYKNFTNYFKTDYSYNVCKEYLHKINTNFTNICSFKTEQEANENLKFYLIDTVINFASFVNCFI